MVTQTIKGKTMKYLTMTFTMAFMAFGFASIMATPAQANELCYDEYSCNQPHGDSSDEHMRRGAEVDGVEPLEQFADKEDGVDGGGESGGGDFSEGDRAAASTAAE